MSIFLKRISLWALAVLMVYAAAVAARPLIGNIPLTRHAQQQHVGQLYDATKIITRINTRTCSPIETYTCKDTIVVMCPVGPDQNALWMGLVIGTAKANPQVVTGYAAPAWYWHSRVAGCEPTALIP